MRVKSVLIALLGLGTAVVLTGWELVESFEGGRPKLVVGLRRRSKARGRCGRCNVSAPWFDRGGGMRSWRHVDVGFATCELVGEAPRVSCPDCGPTVVQVPWARHDSRFSRAFEDLVVFDAIVSNKLTTARRYGISWRAVNNMCGPCRNRGLGACGPVRGARDAFPERGPALIRAPSPFPLLPERRMLSSSYAPPSNCSRNCETIQSSRYGKYLSFPAT